MLNFSVHNLFESRVLLNIFDHGQWGRVVTNIRSLTEIKKKVESLLTRVDLYYKTHLQAAIWWFCICFAKNAILFSNLAPIPRVYVRVW